jgi:hypothetical protein
VGSHGEEFVDGGAALVARPYTPYQWPDVSRGWWWHQLGMFGLAPIYPVIALTVWQRPSGQPLARRIIWALAMTLGASLLIGLPAAIMFSRRWYWLYRTGTDPEEVGVGATTPDAASGYLGWVAVGGSTLADRLTRRPDSTPELPRGPVHEPWASLLGEATRAVARIERAVERCTGPATKPMVGALKEATAAVAAAHRVAVQASEVEEALTGLGVERVEQQLRTLEASTTTSADVDATKRALSEQLATASRMRDFLTTLEQQLQRLVAQLGEAAARADELAVCPPGEVGSPLAPDMTEAVDRLAAIRSALEAVEGPSS